MKTCLYNFDPLKPQFYFLKVGFKGSKLYRHAFVMPYSKTGVYRGIRYFFYFCPKNSRYSLELLQQGSSNEYPQSTFGAEI